MTTGSTPLEVVDGDLTTLAVDVIARDAIGFEAAEIEVEEAQRHLESGSRLERIVFAVRGEAARRAFEDPLAASPRAG